MNAAVNRNAFCALERFGVNHVHRTGIFPDANQNAATVLGDGQVIGMPAESHLFQYFRRLSIHNIHDGFRFVADIDALPIGRKGDAVWEFDSVDHLHYLIGRRIDYVYRVAGAVGDVDSSGSG